MKVISNLLASAAILAAGVANAGNLEVTHWWTSGGEAAAVSVLAEKFNAQTDHTWVDGAIAGGGGTSVPVIISRIIGGDPMGATQLNHGRQAQELIEAGLMTDLTELADAQGWRQGEGRRSSGRMGSVQSADHHRNVGRGEIPGPD